MKNILILVALVATATFLHAATRDHGMASVGASATGCSMSKKCCCPSCDSACMKLCADKGCCAAGSNCCKDGCDKACGDKCKGDAKCAEHCKAMGNEACAKHCEAK